MFGLLLLDEVPLRGVEVALDVGCGTGFPLIELSERLGSRACVHGLDGWSAGLRHAAAKIAYREILNVRLHEGNATMMPFADSAFDLIVSNLALSNFGDRTAAIRECRRVARPGAVLALAMNVDGYLRELYAIFAEVLDSVGDGEACQRLRKHVARRGTIAGTGELLEAGGFSVTRVVERTSRVRFADGRALLHHHFIKLVFLAAWNKVQPIHDTDTFLRLRSTLDESAAQAGELALTIPMAYIEGVAV